MTNQPGELGAAIEQIDRDAAASYLMVVTGSIGLLSHDDITAGRWDDTQHVQAFARHRISATPTRDDGEGDVERMRAERDEARAITKRVQSSAKTIMIGEADELLKLREEKRGEWLASKTLDSEREANAILTEENATLRAALSTAAAARDDGVGDVDIISNAAELLCQYAYYIRSVHSSELERHPYLPLVEDTALALSALSQKGGE